MTGITGSIGSWLARVILEDGYPIIAVVRAKSSDHASRRVGAVLKIVGAENFEKSVTAIPGDITQPQWGIDDLNSLRQATALIHCAASMGFREDQAEENELVNVFGTEQVLQLAETLHIPVCHFSTAYIAGCAMGTAFETQIDAGQSFHNSYEATKCRAESKIREWTQRTNLPAFVFRPGIVVGDSENGRIQHFDGMYNLLRFFDNIRQILGQQSFRAVANPDATKNIIPVDFVAKTAWAIIRSGQSGTYHLTHPEPIWLDTLRAIFSELMNVPGVRFVSEEEYRQHKPSKYELLYQRTSNYYQPYLRDEPRFDRTNTDAALSAVCSSLRPALLDRPFFARLLDYARNRQWGKDNSNGEAVQSCLGRDITDYFDEFLASKTHQPLLPELRRLTASCRVIVDGHDEQGWGLRICKGQLEEISRNGIDHQCSFYVDRDSFHRIVSGRQSPQQAFFDKKIEIRGNMETGLKLATVLAAFFRKYPYQAQRREA